MSSLTQKDRASLCSFTFSDGRRCRTPRNRNHPHFCFYHAQKEARARAAQSLGKDLAYFFSGDYLSACDLSTAMARLIPAVVRGDVKPRAARTVAYLTQILLQAIHISEDEYINAFGTDGWRKSIRNSVKYNHDYRFPPAPKPEQPESSQPQSQPAQPQPHASNPAPTPATCSTTSSRIVTSTCSHHKPAQAAPVAASHNLTPSQLSGPFTRSTQTPARGAPASNVSAHEPSNPTGEPSQHPFANRSAQSATLAVHPKSRPLRGALRPQLPPLHRRQTLLEPTLA